MYPCQPGSLSPSILALVQRNKTKKEEKKDSKTHVEQPALFPLRKIMVESQTMKSLLISRSELHTATLHAQSAYFKTIINSRIINWSKPNITIKQALLFPSPSDTWALCCTQVQSWLLVLGWDTNSIQQLLFLLERFVPLPF